MEENWRQKKIKGKVQEVRGKWKDDWRIITRCEKKIPRILWVLKISERSPRKIRGVVKQGRINESDET